MENPSNFGSETGESTVFDSMEVFLLRVLSYHWHKNIWFLISFCEIGTTMADSQDFATRTVAWFCRFWIQTAFLIPFWPYHSYPLHFLMKARLWLWSMTSSSHDCS